MGKKRDKAARESNAAGDSSMDVKSLAKGAKGKGSGLANQPSKDSSSNDSSNVTIAKASKKLQRRASQAYAQANGVCYRCHGFLGISERLKRGFTFDVRRTWTSIFQ